MYIAVLRLRLLVALSLLPVDHIGSQAFLSGVDNIIDE